MDTIIKKKWLKFRPIGPLCPWESQPNRNAHFFLLACVSFGPMLIFHRLVRPTWPSPSQHRPSTCQQKQQHSSRFTKVDSHSCKAGNGKHSGWSRERRGERRWRREEEGARSLRWTNDTTSGSLSSQSCTTGSPITTLSGPLSLAGLSLSIHTFMCTMSVCVFVYVRFNFSRVFGVLFVR